MQRRYPTQVESVRVTPQATSEVFERLYGLSVAPRNVVARGPHEAQPDYGGSARHVARTGKRSAIRYMRHRFRLPMPKFCTTSTDPQNSYHGLRTGNEEGKHRETSTPMDVLLKSLELGNDVLSQRTTSPDRYGHPTPLAEGTASIHRRYRHECATGTQALIYSRSWERAEKLSLHHKSISEGSNYFLTCTECSQTVCPGCVTVCDEGVCCQVMCREHGSDGRCAYHQHV